MEKLHGKPWPALFGRAFACLSLTFCILCWNAQADEPAKFHLRIGFSSHTFVNTPSEDIRVAIMMLSQKVARKTLGSAESRIYDSTQEIERDLKARQVDVIALMPEEFIFLRNRVPLEPMVVTSTDSGNTFEILLLVRKENQITGIWGLRDRAIVMPPKITQYGNMYNIWVETLLLREGIPDMARFFSSVREARTSSQGLLPVFFRNADACVVTSNSYDLACELNPQIGRELKVIARIKGLAGGVIVIRRDLPEQRKLQVRQALLTLHEDQEGKQMLVLFQLSRLVPFPPEYLKTTEALLEEHHLKARMVRR
jgi:phosphonate transport system substrate-binding protein